MKKRLVLCIALLCMIPTIVFAKDSAVKNNQKMIINSQSYEAATYRINDNNYFKLRDLAELLKGTNKAFGIAYEASTDQVSLYLEDFYSSVGNELSKDMPETGSAASSYKFYLYTYPNGDGRTYVAFLKTYPLYDNNYVKLREIGQLMNFYIGYDESTKSIVIDTNKTYVDPRSTDEKIETMIEFALSQIGRPYATLDSFPSYDCSGLVTTSMHVANLNTDVVRVITWSLPHQKGFVEIPMKELRRGDILNKDDDHIMIYLGDNKVVESVPGAGVRVANARRDGYKAFRIKEN
ncbi:MAG: C40 family peptidase [Tissierellia bacterium]|nr:C40 family peptidase [Tissierellia bacterium]